MFEVVPPNLNVSGLIINPLVAEIAPGKSTLVSMKYISSFRDLTYKIMDDLFKPKEKDTTNTGLGIRNKKLEERMQKEREAAA